MTYYVLSKEDGDSYPSVFRIFSTEEKAMEYVASYETEDDHDHIKRKLTHYYDLTIYYDERSGYQSDPLWLGKCEEGKEITYYKAITSEWHYFRIEPADLVNVRPIKEL